MPMPTSAKNCQAGASRAASQAPAPATTARRSVALRTGPSTRPDPCEAKYRVSPIPKNANAGPAQRRYWRA